MKKNEAAAVEQSLWDSVAAWKPCLKTHLHIKRHRYRNKVSYVLEDPLRAERYRFSLQSYLIVGLMNGANSLQQIDARLTANTSTNYSREQLLETVRQLDQFEALATPPPPPLQAARPVQQNRSTITEQLKKSPLYLKLPLFNPQYILSRYLHFARPLFSRTFLVVLLALYVVAGVKLILVWPELTGDVIDRIFTRENLLILWITYPVVKSVHEFAHAFCVKHFGGEVHEMGLMVLLLIPVPYVNASDSGGFADKWQRIAVAAAGIAAELALASIALFVWTAVEPGVVRSFAFNTILICGFSTLFFNGNPLVRFDGYFILSDLVEIPNLAQRSSHFLWQRIFHLLTGVRGSREQSSNYENRCFLIYGIAAFCYRLTIYLSIFYLFATKLGLTGAFIGVLAIVQILVTAGTPRIRQLLQSPVYREKRSRLLLITGLLSATIVSGVALLPFPYSTTVEGVVHRQDKSLVKMQSPGIITDVAATAGEVVSAGQILFTGEDLQLQHNIQLLESQLQEIRVKEAEAFAKDPFEAKIIGEKRAELEERFYAKIKQANDLTVTSPLGGRFFVESSREVKGSYFRQGDIVAFILHPARQVRAMISQEEITPILEDTTSIDILLVTEPETGFSGRIVSEHPHATRQLAGKALGTAGGGKILLDPADLSQQSSLVEMFQIDIELNKAPQKYFPESRALIRFHHTAEPLIYRWSRRIRQLFLTQFRG